MFKKLLPKSDFSRNVLTLMTGTTIAQAIPVAISPVLTRIYTPEDFGVFALFFAISMTFGSIANGRYELAIMLPAADEDAFNIATLGVLIAGVISLILLLVVVFFNQSIAQSLGNGEIAYWLYLAPVSVFFIGLFNVLNYLNNRLKNYNDIARATIYKSLVLATVQLIVGFLRGGAVGLVSGQVLSNAFANLKLLKNVLDGVNVRQVVSVHRMKGLAKRYQNFPKYTMWATLANSLSMHLTSILVSVYFSVTTLGFYSLVQKALGLPSSLIGNSVGQVYFQVANKERQDTGKAINIFDSTVKKLTLVAVPSFGLLFFIVEDLFALVFGENWRIAGTYAMILIPMFAVRFVFTPVSITCSIYEKQRVALLMQLGLLSCSTFIIVLSGCLHIDFTTFLFFFSMGMCIYYIFFLFIVRLIAQQKI